MAHVDCKGWHLMTGLGAYSYIVWAIWLRRCQNAKHDEHKLHWPRLTAMPVVIRTHRTASRHTRHKENEYVEKES